MVKQMILIQHFSMSSKQGFALKNWVEGLSDEAYYPWESLNTIIGLPYICQRTKKNFNSSINGNLRVFQNHRKQAKINVVFHRFPL